MVLVALLPLVDVAPVPDHAKKSVVKILGVARAHIGFEPKTATVEFDVEPMTEVDLKSVLTCPRAKPAIGRSCRSTLAGTSLIAGTARRCSGPRQEIAECFWSALCTALAIQARQAALETRRFS
jgi:hypothetical protein